MISPPLIYLVCLFMGIIQDDTVTLITTVYKESEQAIHVLWEFTGVNEKEEFNVYRSFQPINAPDQLTEEHRLTTVKGDIREYMDAALFPNPVYYAVTLVKNGEENRNLQYDQNYTGEPIQAKISLPIDGLVGEFNPSKRVIELKWEFVGAETQKKLFVKIYRNDHHAFETIHQINDDNHVATLSIQAQQYNDSDIRSGSKYYYAAIPYEKESDTLIPMISAPHNSLLKPIETGIDKIVVPFPIYINDILPERLLDLSGIAKPNLIVPDTPITRWGIFEQMDSIITPQIQKIIASVPLVYIKDEVQTKLEKKPKTLYDKSQDINHKLVQTIALVYHRDHQYEQAASLLETLYTQLDKGYNKSLALLYLARSLYHLQEYKAAYIYLVQLTQTTDCQDFQNIIQLFLQLCREKLADQNAM